MLKWQASTKREDKDPTLKIVFFTHLEAVTIQNQLFVGILLDADEIILNVLIGGMDECFREFFVIQNSIRKHVVCS